MTAQAAERAARARRWELATDWPLIIAGIIFFGRVRDPHPETRFAGRPGRLVSVRDLDYVGDLRD
jgi:hypothetical protein